MRLAIFVIMASLSTLLILAEAFGFLPQSWSRWLNRNRLSQTVSILRELGFKQDNAGVDNGRGQSLRIKHRLDDFTIKKEVAVGMVDDKIFPEYIDLQGACTEQRQAAFFVRALAAKARSVDRLYDKAGIFTFDFVAAPITGSPILAYEFSQIVGKPLFLHRQAEKFKSSDGAEIHATFDLSVRAPAAGARFVIVDDSTTGGNKVLSLLRDLENFGYKVEDCLIVFEPKGKDARDKLRAVGVQLHTVVEGPEAINV